VRVTTDDAASLQSTPLDGIDAIVVGGLDRLAASDEATLERFMREREGAVVLLPDSRNDVKTAARRLSMPAATEVLLEKGAPLLVEPPLPSFAVSEMLTFDVTPPSRVLARATVSNAPVILDMAFGGGRLLISGALDAWRYRADDNAAFDRFWQASIAGAAMAAAPAIDVRLDPAVAAPGEAVRVYVRVRRSALGLTPSQPTVVSALVNAADPVRLWPDPASDTFVGTFAAPHAEGVGRVDVSVDGESRRSVAAPVAVARDVRTARPGGAPLSLLSQSRSGVDVTTDKIAALTRRLRHEIVSPPTRVERRPMRSAWWILPFTACLGGEWWLRRRRGLR
jgi:hypothetical protein